MTKVFKFVYEDKRKDITFSLVGIYCAIGIMLSSSISFAHSKLIFNLVQLLIAGILTVYILLDLILKRQKVSCVFVILGVYCVLNLIISRSTQLLAIFILVYSLKTYNFKELMAFLLKFVLITFAIIITLSLFKVLPDDVHMREDALRHTLGFECSTLSQSIFMFVILSSLYVYQSDIKLELLITEFIISSLLYYLTNSRTGFYLSILIILIALIVKYVKPKFVKLKSFLSTKIVRYILCSIPILITLVCFAIALCYNSEIEFMSKLDKMLSGRLTFSHNALEEHKINLFGQQIDWFRGGNYIGIDCSYLFVFYKYGIIGAIIIFAFYAKGINYSLKNKDLLLFLCLMVCMVDSIVEPYIDDYKYNLFAFLLIDFFKKEEKQIDLAKGADKLIKSNEKKVTAVVVTYNRKELLKESILALSNQDYKPLSILIVDNASTDGTYEYIKDLIGRNVEYVNTGANLGGAGGFNFGMRKAVENGADYVWIMDDDCIVHNDSLTALLSASENLNDNFGYLSSQVLWQDNTPCKMNIQRTSLTREISDFSKNYQRIKLASFVSLFVKSETIENFGLPYKEFFIWGDDWEYTSRLASKLDCYYISNSIVTHKSKNNIGVDIVKDDSSRLDRYFYAYRNERYFYNKNGLNGKLYCFLKTMYHKLKLKFCKCKNKKEKLLIMKKGLKASKTFNPKIEYAYRPNSEIKVCEFFGEPLAYGGQEAFIINMYKNFQDENLKYTFVTPFDLTNKTLMDLVEKRQDKIIHYNYNFNSKLRKSYIKKTLKKLFKENTFDVVHIHTGSIFTILTASKIAKTLGHVKTVIAHSHSTGKNNFKYKLIKKYSDSKIDKYVDVYFACSKLAGQWKFPKEIIEDKKLQVINNGIDLQKYKFNEKTRTKYRKEFGIKDNQLLLCNVGRFAPEKNHEFIVKIANELRQKKVDFKFVLVGEGPLKEQIIQKINELGLIDYFIVLEKRSDIAEIMMASDMFILPSLFEGLAVTSIESQATGLITLCSSTITKETQITDIYYCLDINDPKDWSKMILKHKNDKIDRSKYGKIISDAGYDAKQSAQILESKYKGN